MNQHNSFAVHLNQLAEHKRRDYKAAAQAHLANYFIVNNARSEYNRLLDIIDMRVNEVNKSLNGIPLFQFRRNGPYVRQGSSAVYLAFRQTYSNSWPIEFQLSFGREPERNYADVFSSPPIPERYALEPAMAKEPDRIIWIGDKGEMTSELCDFMLQHLTEYDLERMAT